MSYSTPPPPSAPNLQVIKTASSAYVVPGGTFTYTIVVENLGPSPATGVFLTDPVSPKLEVLDASVTQGSVTIDTNLVTADIGVLGVGYSATLTIVVRVRSNVASGVVIDNIAVGDSDQTGEVTSTSSVIVTGLLPETGDADGFVLGFSAILALLGLALQGWAALERLKAE